MPSQYSIADVLERIYQNQLALEAALGAIDENAGVSLQAPMRQPLFDFDLKRVPASGVYGPTKKKESNP